MAKLRGIFGVVVVAIMAVSLLTGCDSTPVVLTGTVTAQPPGATGPGTGATRPFAAGVDVVVYSDEAETEVAHTTTNLLGGFTFHDGQVPDGTYRLRVHGVWWGGDSWATATPVAVSAAHPASVDVPLTRVGKVSGVIVDAARTGVADVPVWAVDAAGRVVATTTTDTQGAFTLGLLADGDYTVRFANASGVVAAGGTTPVTFTVDDSAWVDHSNDGIAGRLDLATGRQLALDHVTAIAAGRSDTCAVRADGSVWCWGYNVDGALGNGTFNNVSTMPVRVTGISDATAVAMGQGHSCALRRGGTVACWGFNEDGELGTPAPWPRSPQPVTVTGLTDAVAIAAGAFHTCAIRRGGAVACWGYNHSGQLGNGTTVSSTSPVPVAGIDDATSIAGGRYHTCAVHRTGTMSCWGSNDYGAIGNGTDHNYYTTPVTVTGMSDATQVVAGEYHTCARRATGRIACWGANFTGELGNGTYDDSNVPVAVTGITDAVGVSAGAYHGCAVHAAGTVSCWGVDIGYVLMDGAYGYLTVPMPVDGLTNAVTIASGESHACAIETDSTVSCWGSNGGALGNGTAGVTPVPVTVLAG